MTLNTLNFGNNGTIVYQGHAGFLVSTVVCILLPLNPHPKPALLPKGPWQDDAGSAGSRAKKELTGPIISDLGWVLPPLCNSWIIFLLYIYTALNMTPNIHCYRVGAVPKI